MTMCSANFFPSYFTSLKKTYAYKPQAAKFNKTNFENIYSVEEIDYEIVGKLKATELTAIKNCIRNSRTVKRKIRRALGVKI